jgi:DNA (cytosine-5)-methyltransferase 1
MARPIGIDLFAGAGGMSLGFEQAGFDVRAAVEIDPIHCAVHRFNFSECAVIPRSVVGLSAKEIRQAAGLGNEEVDVVFGGPPCQGFSLIGHRSLDDPRNKLVLEFVRIVSELDAKAFVFENVKGLTVGRQRLFLNEIIEAFQNAGYDVRTKWEVLDAAYFEVPQHRQRLILLGARRGNPIPKYPDPACLPADITIKQASLPFLKSLSRGPTCKDALNDLPDADTFPELNRSDEVNIQGLGRASSYARELRCTHDFCWHYGHRRDLNAKILTSSARTEHTAISKRRFAETAPGEIEPISRFFKLSPTGLSNTLRAGTDGARGAFTSPRPIHYSSDRCITVREMARLHGFPDWFRFHATKWHGARQIGNAVPPPLARAVALEVLQSLGLKPKRSRRHVEFGDPELLNMDMSKAAKTFDVSKPKTKRDQKSGAKKRKQYDIERGRLAAIEAAGE